MSPAGFWRRYAAYSFDLSLLLLLASPWLWPRLLSAQRIFLVDLAQVQQRLLDLLLADFQALAAPLSAASRWLNDPTLRQGLEAMSQHLLATSIELSLILTTLAAVYFIASESSHWQASPGKRWLGLRVTDAQGAPASTLRIASRFLAGSLSWLSCNLGHALAAWTPDKRALHDYLAGTRVLRSDIRPWPRAAVVWLIVQALLSVTLLVWIGVRYVQVMQAGLAAGLL